MAGADPGVAHLMELRAHRVQTADRHGAAADGEVVRRKLPGPSRQDVQQTMGWDKGAMSRFLSGEQGVLIDKLDTLVGVCGYVLVTRK